ncbi:RsmB/NOP family class I SAM-dependent RNA methyltransferase [Saccharothrix coeruleofusca]|uniref:Methyltransferase n=1 Tax=Saccharothrix coeruleofusca TaxID=33919 RepID=A0A918EFN4_9PSEU|nr:RsmB/NOP family class I SAM-dependent RNA methyltransferase [Saccharothrix coeruleofusca]MBP2337816.1 16S rRNA (cytosine967-C5)-methyltransferase [Saccharothrix coeruleofusca]GGP62464.1 methyltransferase [Saccharothrix coeruleofusca]
MSAQRPSRPSRPRGPHPPRRRVGPSRPPVEDPARLAALDTLRAVRQRDAYANLVLPGLLRERRITGRDAALATELAYGTSRAQGLLDAVLGACSDRPLSEVDGSVLDALRLGAYQLLRTRIPPHAAVASTVDLVRAELGSGAAGFANAVLRRVTEQDEAGWVEELAPDEDADPIGYLAMASAHPRWVAQAFAEALGSRGEPLRAALAADDARPAVHLAARPGEVSADELAAMTGGEVAPYSPYGVHLEPGAGDPGDLEPVRERLAAVQDEGSQLCALALTRAPLEGPDERWLDLCAGPGGKAVLLGALAHLSGATVDAVEKAPHRAELVRKAVGDLPVTVHVGDGRDPDLPEGGFDRVLVDAPCTGLGALRRRPEARWRRQPADVAPLARLQRELLTSALRLVRPGGVVAYVVCSPHLAETVGVVADVARRTGAERLDTRQFFPGVPNLGQGPQVQLWPHEHGTDAMFCALLRRPA